MTKPKFVLHVKAGNSTWEPTIDEMDNICSLFDSALIGMEKDGSATVVTRDGITPTVLQDPKNKAHVVVKSKKVTVTSEHGKQISHTISIYGISQKIKRRVKNKKESK